MRTLLIPTALVLLLAACNNNQQTAEPVHEHHTDTTAAVTTASEHMDHGGKLTLNNGQKWKLDEPTRKNMGEIKQLVRNAAKQPAPNYHQLATDLQAATDQLIGQCRMSGPDHEALHLWLQDFLPALKELHSANKSIQKNAFHTIHAQAEQFDTYFE